MSEIERIIDVMLLALNAANTVPDSAWYAQDVPMSSTGKSEGKLARIQLWHLTARAARESGLLN